MANTDAESQYGVAKMLVRLAISIGDEKRMNEHLSKLRSLCGETNADYKLHGLVYAWLNGHLIDI